MLGKLLKYEFKGLRIPVLIMILILASTTLLSCIILAGIKPTDSDAAKSISMITFMFSLLLYYFGVIGCSIGAIIVIAVRFYKTCYSDQGYLTHTLPVSTRKLLSAKIISSFWAVMTVTLAIIVTVYIIINIFSSFIMSVFAQSYSDYRYFGRGILSLMLDEFAKEFGISFVWYAIYLFAFYIISVLSNIITILGCVSLGQLYVKHRVLGAIIAYFVVQFIIQTLGYFAQLPMYGRMIVSDREYSSFQMMSPTMNLMLLIQVAMGVAMYFVNMHMMTKKLNLE